MDITGKIIAINATEKKSETFIVRTFVIEVENARDPRYNDFLEFQLTGDRCGLLEHYQAGQEVKVHFDIRGRKWTAQDGKEKYFTTLAAWQLSNPQQQPATNEPAQAPIYGRQQPAAQQQQSNGDLPF